MSRITMALENGFEGRVLASFDLDEFASKVRADADAENEISYDVGYEKGRADYEAECQKIFEDNPPMHFNHEQIIWLKEFVKIRCNQARADAINECIEALGNNIWDIAKLEQLKEQNND